VLGTKSFTRPTACFACETFDPKLPTLHPAHETFCCALNTFDLERKTFGREVKTLDPVFQTNGFFAPERPVSKCFLDSVIKMYIFRIQGRKILQ
tara:strand:+ start:4087 stop:4368 length:282 start_codon:yes stop_codon:yes gene_type:complete